MRVRLFPHRLSQHRHHGRQRHFEGSRRSPGAFVPSSVTRTGKDEFLFPTARIADNLSDGDRVDVEVASEMPLTERNAPEMSVWAALAFSHSDATEET